MLNVALDVDGSIRIQNAGYRYLSIPYSIPVPGTVGIIASGHSSLAILHDTLGLT
jgi:hypothetical protein